jgi:hypothetical protein
MPAPGLGSKAWVGWSEESTWGTGVTPTSFYKMAGGETVRWNPTFYDDPSLAGASLWEVLLGSSTVGGDIPLPVRWEGLELLFKHLLGAVSTSGAGPDYTHTFTPDDDLPTGLTLGIYRGMPTDKMFQVVGTKLTGGSFRVERNAPLMFTPSFIGKAETLESKETPTYPDADLIKPSQLVVTTSGLSGDVDVLAATINIDQPLTEDRFDLASSGAFKEPQRSGKRIVEVSIDGEFSAEAQYTVWTGETEGDLIFTWTGAAINGSAYELAMALHGKFVERPPQVPDAGPVTMGATFRCFATDAKNDISVSLTNTVSSV